MREFAPDLRLLCLAGLLFMGSATQVRAAEEAAASGLLPTVTVDTARKAEVVHVVVGNGTVAAWREISISSEVDGLPIVAVLADEGDRVRKGQLLARLNQSVLLAQKIQRLAEVAAADAALTIAIADQGRAHAVTKGVLSQQAIDQRDVVVKTAKARLDLAQGALEESNARLLQTEIVAPADAVVAVRTATVGQIVQTGTDLFRLIQDGRIEVNAAVPEHEIFSVQPQQPVEIADPMGRISSAHVRRVSPVVDAKTRLGTVRIAVGADANLMPGMFVRVRIQTKRTEPLTIPFKALVWRDGQAATYVVGDDGTAVIRAITVGRTAGSVVEIVEGLAPGERIVVEGAGLLSDGEKVRAVVASAQSPTATP